jgi:hypothetical protein
LARQAFAALSKNRHLISRWMRSEDEESIAGELRNVELQACAIERVGAPISSLRDYLQ